MDLTSAPPSTWVDAYRSMARIRAFEERALDLVAAGEIPGVIHSSAGQEAVAVGATANLGADDYVTSTHRGHGHLIARGVDLGALMAELFGRETGLCRGRGGTMHLFDLDRGFLGTNGIVGGGLPIAVGAALALRLSGRPGVVAAFLGDGAVNTGAFHEALNLAAVWHLPVLFVCENNRYAESTPLNEALPLADLRPRAASYGMEAVIVDGNDVAACRTAVGALAEACRAEGGPRFVQADTYRLHGHYSGDPGGYRAEEEVERWRAVDPLARLRAALVETWPEETEAIGAIHGEVSDEVEAAVAFARASPEPSGSAVARHVFAPAGA